MIPTLAGRLQTRLILFFLIGVPVTLIFALVQTNFIWSWREIQIFVYFLCSILALGLFLDPIYIFIQSTRWDRDWPFAYQFFFSWIEFGIVLFVARSGWLPYLDPDFFQGFRLPIIHFTLVFVPSYLFLLGPLQAIFVRWRFKGGQLGKM